jgi:hypothetical protein
MHLKAHGILESLVEHGYVGIDERSKVRHLMDSIKTKTLDAAKAQIMSNPDLRTNFNACVTLFKDFIAQERYANGNERQVAALTLGNNGGSDPNDRYVPDSEWKAMSKDERDKIIATRKAARQARKDGGNSSGGGKGKGKKGGARKSRQTKWMKKEVKRQVAKVFSAKSGDDNDEDNGEEELPMKTEDGHKMRQASKKKTGSK